MEEKEVKKETKDDMADILENEDVKALEEMKKKYEQELAKEKQKYSQLLAYTVKGGPSLTDNEQKIKELTPKEKWDKLCDTIKNKKSTNIEIAQALVEGDSLYRQANNGRSIFCSEEGTLSDKEEKIADTVVSIISESLEKADGNDKLYTTISSSSLI